MKKKKSVEIKISLSNRWLYTLIIIGILAIVGIGVYAWANPSTGVGHDLSELEVCSNGEILQMSGEEWECIDAKLSSAFGPSGGTISTSKVFRGAAIYPINKYNIGSSCSDVCEENNRRCLLAQDEFGIFISCALSNGGNKNCFCVR